MQATMNDVRHEFAEATGEAARTAAEASRRTIEGMQAATQVGRNYLEQSNELSRTVLTNWATGLEATLKVGFELQDAALGMGHAALHAGIATLDTAANSYRNVTQQWVTVARQTQKAALQAFWLNVQTMEKVVFGATKPEEESK